MIVSMCFLSSCKVDDLSVTVDENAKKANEAIDSVSKKADADIKANAEAAAADLADAKTQLEKLIAEGDAADKAAIAAAVEELNKAVAAAEAAYKAADADLKAELLKEFGDSIDSSAAVVEAIAAKALREAKAELEVAIAEGDANTSAELSKVIVGVTDKLSKVDLLVQETAAKADDALKAEIIELMNAAKAELTQALKDAVAALEQADRDAISDLTQLIEDAKQVAKDGDDALLEAINAAKMEIDSWNDATDAVIAAIDEIEEYLDNLSWPHYYEEDLDALEKAINGLQYRLLRAPTREAVEDLMATFKDVVDSVQTKAQKIEAIITFDGTKTIDDIEVNVAWDTAIKTAQEMLNAESDLESAGLTEVKAMVDNFYRVYLNKKLLGA